MSTCSKRLSGVIAAISITALTAATFMGIKSTPSKRNFPRHHIGSPQLCQQF